MSHATHTPMPQPLPQKHVALTLEEVASVSPALAHYTAHGIVGDLWQRPDLAHRDRCLATLSIFMALGQNIGTLHYAGLALDAGITPLELSELATHMAFYAGWAKAFASVDVLATLYRNRGIDTRALPAFEGPRLPLAEALPDAPALQTFTREQVAPVSAALTHYTDALLHHDIWLRPGLQPRLRCLATVSALMATGQATLLPVYLERALHHGLTRQQIGELLAHVAFYAGWPAAMTSADAVGVFFKTRG